jgi:hypothetical protein
MQHSMRLHADHDGVLVGRAAGEEARHQIEHAIGRQTPGTTIALDFEEVRAVSVPFADALLVPLISNRLTGYYEDHPLLVINANEDVRETLAATLARRNLFVLGVPPPKLLGGEETLDETIRVADELSPFTVLTLARKLGITQQAANNRLKALLRSGALARKRTSPARGGKEFIYEVPRPDRAQPATGRGPSRRRSSSDGASDRDRARKRPRSAPAKRPS